MERDFVPCLEYKQAEELSPQKKKVDMGNYRRSLSLFGSCTKKRNSSRGEVPSPIKRSNSDTNDNKSNSAERGGGNDDKQAESIGEHSKEVEQIDNNNEEEKDEMTTESGSGMFNRSKSGQDYEENGKNGLSGLKNKIKSYPDKVYATFANEVSFRRVVLEDIFISEREVSLLIAISSDEHHPDVTDAHRPKVTVRYTTDSWESVSNTDAKQVSVDENNNKAFQRFFLTVSVPLERSFEFAIRSIKGSGISWDNNNNGNYRVENVMENEGPKILIAKFIPLKQAMLGNTDKPVALKDHSLKEGKVTLTIATKERCNDCPVVRYTLDDWKSYEDATSTEIKGKDENLNTSEIQLDIPKQTTMKFAIRWRHEGIEYWDNNDGRNFEI